MPAFVRTRCDDTGRSFIQSPTGAAPGPRPPQSGRALAAYARLVPTVRASGDRGHLGRITKNGSRWLRWILVEATDYAGHQLAYQARFERLRCRRGKHEAAVALARHLAHVV